MRPGEPGGFMRLPLGGHARMPLWPTFNPATASKSASRHRYAGRAGRANCGALLPCDADRIRQSEFLPPSGRFGDHLSERVGDERRPPELEAMIRRPFEAHAIHGRHVNPVGDGVAALDGPPRIQLRGPVLRFFRRMPADGRWIKKNIRAARCSKGARLPDTIDPSRPARPRGRSACRNSRSPGRRA